jgi:hypothetical protein
MDETVLVSASYTNEPTALPPSLKVTLDKYQVTGLAHIVELAATTKATSIKLFI